MYNQFGFDDDVDDDGDDNDDNRTYHQFSALVPSHGELYCGYT